MAEASLPSQYNIVLPFIAAEQIPPYRCVAIKAGTDNEIVIATDLILTGFCIGISLPKSAKPYEIGDTVDVLVHGIGLIEPGVTIGGTISIKPGADGKAAKTTGNSGTTMVGLSLRKSTTSPAPDLLEMLVLPVILRGYS